MYAVTEVKKRWKSTRDYYKKIRMKYLKDLAASSPETVDVVAYPIWPYYNGFYIRDTYHINQKCSVTDINKYKVY